MLLRRIIARGTPQVMAVIIVLTARSSFGDSDQLSAARRRLRSAPCGTSLAVAGVAGVNADPHQAYVGDWLIVSVCHLEQLLKAAEIQQAPITLHVEGMDTGNEPAGVDQESGTLTFVLDRNAKNRQLWRPFLYDPLFDPQVTLHVSVGIRGERPLPRVPGANLQVRVEKIYVDWTTWLWLARSSMQAGGAWLGPS